MMTTTTATTTTTTGRLTPYFPGLFLIPFISTSPSLRAWRALSGRPQDLRSGPLRPGLLVLVLCRFTPSFAQANAELGSGRRGGRLNPNFQTGEDFCVSIQTLRNVGALGNSSELASEHPVLCRHQFRVSFELNAVCEGCRLFNGEGAHMQRQGLCKDFGKTPILQGDQNAFLAVPPRKFEVACVRGVGRALPMILTFPTSLSGIGLSKWSRLLGGICP